MIQLFVGRTGKECGGKGMTDAGNQRGGDVGREEEKVEGEE